MRLFAISLIGDAKIWIDVFSKGSIRNLEELEKALKIRWCSNEHTRDFFSQYLDIYQGSCEGVRDFNDRFNVLLKKVRPKLSSEEAILEHYLSSEEAILEHCMAKGKGVSSRANLLISLKILVGNDVTIGHHAKAVSPD
jgi:hypothetical protein